MAYQIQTTTLRLTPELRDIIAGLPNGLLRYIQDVSKAEVDNVMNEDENKGFRIVYTDTHCPPSICQLVIFKEITNG